jgi:hypothetical protein
MTINPKLRVVGVGRVLRLWLKLTWTPRNLLGRFEDWMSGLTVLRPGTRVRFNGKCCRSCVLYKGKMGTITDDGHDIYDRDYHVRIDGKRYTSHNDYDYDYACTDGFDVVEYR